MKIGKKNLKKINILTKCQQVTACNRNCGDFGN